MISIAHRIQLIPNNKQKTYFRKAIGCNRLAYNWGLAEWERRHKKGETLLNDIVIRNAFNAIRRELFPFTYEVTKYATSYAFKDLYNGFKNFFAKRAGYPKPHKKKEGCGSFYVCCGERVSLNDEHKGMKHLKGVAHNTKRKHQYLNVPNLGYVKMSERLRFNGKINYVRIKQEGEKFFAVFSVNISEEEYIRTHSKSAFCKEDCAVGIDIGLKDVMTLSDGIVIKNPHSFRKHERKLARTMRQLERRVHVKTKQDRKENVSSSNNYRKAANRLRRLHQHIANERRDFQHKLTTVISTSYKYIVVEDADIAGWLRSRKVSKAAWDTGAGEIRREIKYKSAMKGVRLVLADQYYASSKICSHCGSRKEILALNERIYRCPHCGAVMDRDFNASLNLLSLLEKQIGVDYSKLTPVDLKVLQSRFALNGIATSKVDTGRQQKPQCRNIAAL